MWELFERVKKNFSLTQIATQLNVAIGTVRRWNEKQSVPESYRFDLMKMNGEKIDYSLYTPKDKDQFFTPNDTAKYCIDKTFEILNQLNIDLSIYTFIEPSAGSGTFIKYLPKDRYLAFDIENQGNLNITIQDFLDWVPDQTQKYIVIGNPPFGLRGQKALQFINKSLEFADFVCFILPPLFNSDGKGSPKKRINAKLIHTEEIITKNYFYPDGTSVNINTIFQIWTKTDFNIDLNTTYTPIGYKVYSLSDGGTPSSTRNKDKLYSCDYYLPSTVFGTNNMKLYDSFEDLPQRRGYGIIIEDQSIRSIIKKIDWSKEAFYSTNNAINLRTSLIAKAIETKKS